MIHNVTEGLGIATPVAKTRTTILALAGLALVAGAPTILGAWLGGYTTSDVLAALFFGIAAGAAFQVVVEVGRYVARQAPGRSPLRARDRRLPRRASRRCTSPASSPARALATALNRRVTRGSPARGL